MEDVRQAAIKRLSDALELAQQGLPPTVRLGDLEHPVKAPGFAKVEQMMLAHNQAMENVGIGPMFLGGVIGCCTAIGSAAGTSMRKCRYDLLAFGELVFDYLMEQGVPHEEIDAVAWRVYYAAVAERFPTEDEVSDKAGFTHPAEGG